MRTISGHIYSHIGDSGEIVRTTCDEVRAAQGRTVGTFEDLVECVAELSFKNPSHVLLYRGQHTGYTNDSGSTTLYPRIFRSRVNRLMAKDMQRRFSILDYAEDVLADQYIYEGERSVRVDQILRWALLQHYEVCDTPFLDLTQSLRVAASFATNDNQGPAVIYALGVPQLGSSVSVASSEGLQSVRLNSICPPRALRPYYQQGYLVGEYPTMSLKGKKEYERREVDMARRLIGKYIIRDSKRFWNSVHLAYSEKALLPNARDEMYKFMQDIHNLVKDVFPEGGDNLSAS